MKYTEIHEQINKSVKPTRACQAQQKTTKISRLSSPIFSPPDFAELAYIKCAVSV